ncbi:MAG: hypothetical protein AAFN11_14880, partial [Chloroflexota bacterium]
GEQPFLGYSLSQGKQYSEATASQIDILIREIIDSAYDYTLELLTENREALDIVANALLEREVLERAELLEIMGMDDDKPLDAPAAAVVDMANNNRQEDAESPDELTRREINESDDPFAMFTETDADLSNNDDTDEGDGDDDKPMPPSTPSLDNPPDQSL